MNILDKISRMIFAFVAAPLYWVEKREAERKLEERLKRSEHKLAKKST